MPPPSIPMYIAAVFLPSKLAEIAILQTRPDTPPATPKPVASSGAGPMGIHLLSFATNNLRTRVSYRHLIAIFQRDLKFYVLLLHPPSRTVFSSASLAGFKGGAGRSTMANCGRDGGHRL